MTPEVFSIIGVGIVLAGIILTGQRTARADYRALRAEIEQHFERLGGRIAALEGLTPRSKGALPRSNNASPGSKDALPGSNNA